MYKWCLVCLLVGPCAFAQSNEIDLEKLIDTNALLDDEEQTMEEINTLLLDAFSSPLDLNQVTEEILSGIQLLTPEQLRNFFNYRLEFGPFLSIWELQQIDGWDAGTCNMVAGISTVGPLPQKRIFENFGQNTEILTRVARVIERKEGFTDAADPFQGDRNQIQLRIKSSNPGDYLVAIAMENDAGENFSFKTGRTGFDHISGNVSFFDKGPVKKIVIGDYRLQFGQGLIYGGSFGGRKSSEPILSIRKSTSGIIPSSSFSEFGFLRGAAMSLEKNSLNLTTYISSAKKDGLLYFDSLHSEQFISSFNNRETHRNDSEIKINNTVQEKTAGSIITIKKARLELGLQYHWGKYSRPVRFDNEPYRIYRFQGKNFTNGGLFLNYGWQNFLFFHESAMSNLDNLSTITGIILALSKKLDFSLLYRYYSPGYFAPHGNAFGETSAISNETGIFWGIKYQLAAKILASAYFDYFKFPWLRLSVDSPSDGYEYSIRVDYLNKKTPAYILLKREAKYLGTKIGLEPGENFYSFKTNFAFDVKFLLTDYLSGSIRPAAVFTFDGVEKATGFLLKQDLRFGNRNFTFRAGYFLFDTSSFDGRLYAAEPDVRYQSSFPLFNGEGIRYFLLAKFKIKRSLNFWIKYYLTSYNNVDQIGSGKDLIHGNKISEIKTQIIYSFR